MLNAALNIPVPGSGLPENPAPALPWLRDSGVDSAGACGSPPFSRHRERRCRAGGSPILRQRLVQRPWHAVLPTSQGHRCAAPRLQRAAAGPRLQCPGPQRSGSREPIAAPRPQHHGRSSRVAAPRWQDDGPLRALTGRFRGDCDDRRDARYTTRSCNRCALRSDAAAPAAAAHQDPGWHRFRCR